MKPLDRAKHWCDGSGNWMDTGSRAREHRDATRGEEMVTMA